MPPKGLLHRKECVSYRPLKSDIQLSEVECIENVFPLKQKCCTSKFECHLSQIRKIVESLSLDLRFNVGISVMNTVGSVTRDRFLKFSRNAEVGEEAVSGVTETVKVERVPIPFSVSPLSITFARDRASQPGLRKNGNKLSAQRLSLSCFINGGKRLIVTLNRGSTPLTSILHSSQRCRANNVQRSFGVEGGNYIRWQIATCGANGKPF